jgi:DNA-binding CsgD family transcriptional regulator
MVMAEGPVVADEDGPSSSDLSVFAFVISQVGSADSTERARADELCQFVIQPALDDLDLDLKRSDEDPTPGSVTLQIVRSIANASVVIADLTGRNPNVYYELGLAHSFNKPVVILVDHVESLAFDMQDQRVIEIGDNGEEIGARKAQDATEALRRQLGTVLDLGYKPRSPVADAGITQALSEIAPDDPIASELARLGEKMENIERLMQPNPPEIQSEELGPWFSLITALRSPEGEQVIATLSKREQEVLRRRLGLPPFSTPHSYKRIADELGVTLVQIKRLEVSALSKLRHPSRSSQLRDLMEDLS